LSLQAEDRRSRSGTGLIETGRHELSARSGAREWQEYLIEAWALGSFMALLGLVAILLEASASPIRQWIQDASLRRVILAAAMGTMAAVLIYTPWGQRSGAHMNPAVTLAFLRLRKITPRDTLGYIVAQVVGSILGVYVVWAIFGEWFSTPPVGFLTTVPGNRGVFIAFLAELTMSALLMLTILGSASRPRLAPYTGVFAGILIFVFISLEAPLSGMSINPARSLASAIAAHHWTSFWIYILAPLLGMQLAAVFFSRAHVVVPCAKLCHSSTQRCIHCGFQPAADERR
jgi:aquaporin Z